MIAALRIDVVVFCCAISAGIHGALIRDHFGEAAGPGAGFVVATVLLGALAAVLARNPSPPALATAAVVFSGLIVSYALAITIGVPVIHPTVEPVDRLALVTKTVEAVGLATTANLMRRPTVVARTQPRGTLT